MTSPKTSILIIEDEVLIANDISAHLRRLGYVIAGIAYNSDKALDMMSNRSFDLAILDIQLGGSRDGIELAGIINKKYKKPFIYLTSYSDDQTLSRAQKTLPYGYIVKPFEKRNLAATIQMALFKYSSENREKVPALENLNNAYECNLSEREYELIRVILNGNNIKETADLLFVSDNTVKTHLKRIYGKLEVHNRVDFTKKILEVK